MGKITNNIFKKDSIEEVYNYISRNNLFLFGQLKGIELVYINISTHIRDECIYNLWMLNPITNSIQYYKKLKIYKNKQFYYVMINNKKCYINYFYDEYDNILSSIEIINKLNKIYRG